MITLRGKGVSQGVVSGPVCFLRHTGAGTAKVPASDIEKEKARIAAAQKKSTAQLEALAEKARRETDEETARVFETHAMFVEDEDYMARVMAVLEKEHCKAEYAVKTAGDQSASMLSATDDPYLRTRSADILDVTRRLLDNLTGVPPAGIDPENPVILAADDLVPSETLQLDKQKILGFITSGGSANSHTAILARTMGIPAVCGLGSSLLPEYNGLTACMDGETGEVILDPDEAAAALFRDRQKQYLDRKRRLLALKGKEDVTPGGRKLTVSCNISSPDDLDAVLDNDGQGIGLFRSESLFMTTKDYPSEEEQFRVYKRIISAMPDRRVVIRTLDIGADKQADYFHLPKEENPALGLRGIRVSLSRPKLFRTQLRALYRASAFGRAAVMFPMIASLWEVRACKKACADVMAELEAENIPFDKKMETGIMIETPASILIAGDLAREVDFFSVGTNDLTQYILACDRRSGSLDRFFDMRHPALLRAIGMAAEAAHRAGIRIGICGELAADVSLLDTFLSMGIDELSVTPSAVLPLRAAIRGSGR